MRNHKSINGRFYLNARICSEYTMRRNRNKLFDIVNKAMGTHHLTYSELKERTGLQASSLSYILRWMITNHNAEGTIEVRQKRLTPVYHITSRVHWSKRREQRDRRTSEAQIKPDGTVIGPAIPYTWKGKRWLSPQHPSYSKS
jgi:hypothetical protein